MSPPQSKKAHITTSAATPPPDDVDFKKLMHTKSMKVALRYNDFETVGSPFENWPGLKMKVTLDAGRNGMPSIRLDFSFAIDGTDTDEAAQCNHCRIVYAPGVEIEEECKEKLYFLELIVNAHRGSLFLIEWVKALDNPNKIACADVHRTFQGLMEMAGRYKLQLWFCDRKGILKGASKAKSVIRTKGGFADLCLKPLEQAVLNHTLPLHQYRDKDGRPEISLDMPPIWEVGDGMYVKDAEGLSSSYPAFQREIVWESLDEFRIYQTVPVVREFQYTQNSCPILADREITAMNHFCDEAFQPERLGSLRLAFISDPSHSEVQGFLDLTMGPKKSRSLKNKERYSANLTKLSVSRKNNTNQMELLNMPATMSCNVVAVSGLSGTGKTDILADMAVNLVDIGHKLLIVASSKSAVDVDEERIRERLKENGQKEAKSLRLEADDAKRAQFQEALEETDILFTTASNVCGLLEHTFRPSIIFCDDAGQISIPSLAVPLTTFYDWEGLFLFGDQHQLEPKVTSIGCNEFFQNAKLSPLALLIRKGFNYVLLDQQYRMAPSISYFPKDQTYDRKLKDHPKVNLDNVTRLRMRKVAKHFQINTHGSIRQPPKQLKKGQKLWRQFQSGQTRKAKPDGSEYFIVDVANGRSRIEEGANSLINTANAAAILEMIWVMMNNGIFPHDIKVLTYYQGQKRHLESEIRKVNGALWTDEAKRDIKISTIDAINSRESSVIIVDVVAAKDPSLVGGSINKAKDDDGTELFIKQGFLNAHVKYPNRLNVALTRAKDGLVVVCQATMLLAYLNTQKNKHASAIFSMMADAEERKLVCHWNNIIDRRLIENAIKHKRQLRKQKASDQTDIPVYRTAQGIKTRALQLRGTNLVAEAEAADRERRKDRYDLERIAFRKEHEAAKARRQEEEQARQREAQRLALKRDNKVHDAISIEPMDMGEASTVKTGSQDSHCSDAEESDDWDMGGEHSDDDDGSEEGQIQGSEQGNGQRSAVPPRS